jgi:hypothetical protein
MINVAKKRVIGHTAEIKNIDLFTFIGLIVVVKLSMYDDEDKVE